MHSDSESGLVTALQDDKATVRLARNESCDKCAAKIICRPGDDGFREMLAFNRLQASVGDNVEISETGNLLLKLSLIQFGIPLLGLLLGIFLVNYLQPNDTFLSKEVNMSIGGLVGLVAGGFVVWSTLKTWAKKVSCVFEIVRVIRIANPSIPG
jgi:positive regulator of sigma E activity